jgi:hydroxymethylpyrimidine pyrophosphatase-like HAD family hydrolase
LVFLDVDGVIDQRTFGFPCTTQAGIDAISLVHERGLSVALNTARSAVEVRAYCDAYSLAGGVAEHGTYLWDAVGGREQILADAGALRQLQLLRDYLSGLPGVFLDSRHRCSIRAFTYVSKPTGLRASLLQSFRTFSPGAVFPAPLPDLIVEQCISRMGLDRLAVHNTTLDTTVTIRGHDKGTGMAALRDWIAGPDAEIIAVGDSAADLPMFRHATRSFAPAHIDCAREARLLGCRIATQPHQSGLLEITRTITNADLPRIGKRTADEATRRSGNDLFISLLQEADRPRRTQFIRILLHSGLFEAFVA